MEIIAYLVQLFLRDVHTVNNDVTVKPQYIVTDFSFAILNACAQAVNTMTVSSYLKVALKVLQRKKTTEEIRSVTFLCLCMAHMIHCMSWKLNRLALGKKHKQ